MQTSSRESIEFYVRRGFWGEESLESLFRRTVAIHPGRLALIDPPDREGFTDGKHRRLTYSDLFTAVRDVSAKLLAAGLKKDQVVVTQLPNTVETVVLYLAIARIGALLCPMPVEQSTASLAGVALQLQPTMYIGGRYQHRDLLKQARSWLPESCLFGSFAPVSGTDVIDLSLDKSAEPEEIRLLGHIMDTVPVSPNEVFTLTWKRNVERHPAIPRTHNQWFALASFIYEGAGLRNGDNLLCAFPLSEISGIGSFLYNWLMAGARLVLNQTGHSAEILEQVERERIDCMGVPPEFMTELANSLKEQRDLLKHVRCLISGFSPLDAGVARTVAKEGRVVVLNCYSTSEGASLLATPADRCSQWREQLFPRFDDQIEGWSSRMSRMVSTRLVDTSAGDEITDPGCPGELFVKGPSLFDRYYPCGDEQDEECEHDGFQGTGDLFVIDEQNPRFYRFVGRTDQLKV